MVNERYSKAMAETLHYLKGINQNDIKLAVITTSVCFKPLKIPANAACNPSNT